MNGPYRSKALLSAETSALLIVDCQSGLGADLRHPSRASPTKPIEAVVENAKALAVPIISTVYAANGDDAVDPLPLAANLDTIVRACANPWEDDALRARVSDTGRDRIVILGNCAKGGVSFSVLGALETGYQPYVVVDAIHSASSLDASTALTRMTQAGAISLTSRQVMLEWGR